MNRELVRQYLVAFGLIAAVLLAAEPVGTAYAAVTPAGVQAWFDAKLAFIGMGLGIAWKYLPFLSGWTNNAISWLNLALYMIAKGKAAAGVALLLGATPAYAAGFDLGGAISGVVLGGFHAVAARQGWEAFLRPIAEWVSMKVVGKRHPAAA